MSLGTYGHIVSNFLKMGLTGKYIYKKPLNFYFNFTRNPPLAHLDENIAPSKKDMSSLIKIAFEDLNSELLSSIDCKLSGSTANSIILDGNKLYCANTGDSRAVLGSYKDGKWVAKCLSTDHKPSFEREKERIIRAGGRVSKDS